MFTAAMIDPLPPEQREFLMVMGLTDEFTVEMAQFLTGSQNAEAFLTALTEQNAFAKRLPDGVTYRFHHMMKECAERAFHTLPLQKQNRYRNRCGDWYAAHKQYLHAMGAYRMSGNFDAALEVIQHDAGIRGRAGLSVSLPRFRAEGASPCASGSDAQHVQLAADPQNDGAESPAAGLH